MKRCARVKEYNSEKAGSWDWGVGSEIMNIGVRRGFTDHDEACLPVLSPTAGGSKGHAGLVSWRTRSHRTDKDSIGVPRLLLELNAYIVLLVYE